MKLFSLLGKFAAEFLFFIFAYAVGILLLIVWGHTESAGLCAELMAGFIIVSLFRNYAWRHTIVRKHMQRWKHVVLECVIYIVVLQIFLMFTVPISSIIPDTILERTGLVYRMEGAVCNVDQQLEMTKSLWGDQIEYENVRIVQGGFWRTRSAMTFGNTIYFTDISPCPLSYLYFHEMTHIWQMNHQRKLLFGFSTIPSWIRYVYKQFTDSDVLYDYGGVAGLRRARQEGKLFSDFGTEQQAMIVEDRYSANAGYTISPDGEAFTEEYKELLEYYVHNMLIGLRTYR